jgi:flagellar FliJ protein
MQCFQFRLEKVLKWKRHLERLAELRQEQARRAVEQARVEVAALWDLINQDARALLPKMGLPVPAAMWIASYDHARIKDQALKEAEGRLLAAENRLVEASVQRRKALTEVEALVHLRTNQSQEYRDLFLRKQQENLDEVGMRRWLVEIEDSQNLS